MSQKYEIDFGGRSLSFEAGRLAGQADGAVLVRYGDTVLLAAVTAAREPREGADFFPLTVDYEERMYAGGKIPGNFFRREGRPSENAILTMRLTDRPLRPLFPKDFRNDVQIILTAMSYDGENDPDILSIIGASAALMISPIPFDGPIGAVRVGRVNGNFVLNPTAAQMEKSDLDLVVAATRQSRARRSRRSSRRSRPTRCASASSAAAGGRTAGVPKTCGRSAPRSACCRACTARRSSPAARRRCSRSRRSARRPTSR